MGRNLSSLPHQKSPVCCQWLGLPKRKVEGESGVALQIRTVRVLSSGSTNFTRFRALMVYILSL